MRRLFGSLVALLLLAAPAVAQNSKATMSSEVGTNFPDNTSGLITPAILRTTVNDIINSYQNFPGINVQSGTTYTVVAADYGKLIRFTSNSAIAVTLPAASTLSTFKFEAVGAGTGTITFTPSSGTIKDQAGVGGASYGLNPGISATIYSDGTNWQVSSTSPYLAFAGGATWSNRTDGDSFDAPEDYIDHIGATNNHVFHALHNANGDGYGEGIYIIYDRNTTTSPQRVQSGDAIGWVLWQGYNGASRSNIGAIEVDVDGTYTANTNPPGRVDLYTALAGSGQARRFRIDQGGSTQASESASLFPSTGTAQIAGAPVVLQATSNNTGYWELGTSTYNSASSGGWASYVNRAGFGSHTAAQSGDNLWQLWNYGDDGTNAIAAGFADVVVDGAVSAGIIPSRYDFWTANSSGALKLALRLNSSQQVLPSVLAGEADLRIWASTALTCSHGSPTSLNVAQAVVNAYNAGWRAFLIPDGCFIYTGDTPWVSKFGSNVIPNSTRWRGEDAQTSGFSVCSTYTGCTPSAGTTLNHSGGNFIKFQNLFTMDGACYNVDSAAFGNPSRCPVGIAMTGGGSFAASITYPSSAGMQLNVGGESNGTWNGTDTPAFAINQETSGDSIFIQNASGNSAAHIFNLFGNGGAVGTWNTDGKISAGNSSTAHAGNGLLHIQDATATCDIFAGVSNIGVACSSDDRLKHDFKIDEDELSHLVAMKIWTFKDRSGADGIGTRAQEMLKSNPEMVREDDGGYLQVYQPEPWRLVRAIQQLNEKIKRLEAR